MKKYLLLIFIFCSINSLAYQHTEYFSGVLKVTCFYPDGFTGNIPAVAAAHGGGFVSGGRLQKEILQLADSVNSSGVALFTFDYREGFIFPSRDYAEKAMQDFLCGVRWIKENCVRLNIDTNKIFTAGFSAGGFCALSVFMKQSYFKQSNTNNNYSNHSNNVAAAVNFWGGVFDLSYLQNKICPVICIYGNKDTTVPVNCGNSFGVACCGPSAIIDYCNSIGLNSFSLVFDGCKHGLKPKQGIEERIATAIHYAVTMILKYE